MGLPALLRMIDERFKIAPRLQQAYERELHRELARLDQSFDQWREGKISCGELSHRVHQYEAGASRELYKHYNYSPHEMADILLMAELGSLSAAGTFLIPVLRQEARGKSWQPSEWR
jgi:hypothetical protein